MAPARRALNKQGVRTSIRDGGTLIECEDEDPQMQKDIDAAHKTTGVSMEIPQWSYVGI